MLRGVSVYLIGMMGAGKTTVGTLLAQQLHYRFFDTDQVVERVIGQQTGQAQTIAQFFEQQGEAAFRDLESQVLGQVAAEVRCVVATGGGIVLRRENWSYLRQGVIVWLDVPLEQLCQRLQADQTRPLLQTGDLRSRLQELLEQRRSLYAQADVQVTPVTDTPAQVAEQVLEQIQRVLKPLPTPPAALAQASPGSAAAAAGRMREQGNSETRDSNGGAGRSTPDSLE